MAEMTTAWMWPSSDGETHGLTIDLRTHILHWYDGLGCGCDDSSFTQTPHEYQAKGSPLASMPAAIQAEVEATVAALVRGA